MPHFFNVTLSVVYFGFALLWLPVSGAAAEFDQPTKVETSSVLQNIPLKGPNYEIAPTALNYGAVITYTLTVGEITHSVESTDLMLFRLRELRALEDMAKQEASSTFKDTAVSSLKAPIKGAVNLVTSPIDTVGSFVSGVGSFFEGIGHAAVGASSDEEEGVFKSAIGYGVARRAIAKAYKIDPYTSFAPVKDKLSSLSWAASGGSFTVSAGFNAVPGGGGQLIGGLGSVQGLGQLVYDLSPADLKDKNEDALEKMKVAPAVAREFLNHPQYTPTLTTEVISALAKTPVYNRGAFISRALLAQNEEAAFFMMRWAQGYRAYHGKIKPLYRFVRLGAAPVAQREDGTLIAVIPTDQLLWTEQLAKSHFENMADLRKLDGVTGGELWFLGPVSPLVRQNFESENWVVKDNQGATLGLR